MRLKMENRNLEKIMETRREQEIKARRRRATSCKIVDKLYTIVRKLGKEEARCYVSDMCETGIGGDHLVFNYKELRIVAEGDMGSLAYIVEGDKEKLVFSGYKDEMWYRDRPKAKDVIEAYIPGKWERYLPNLYKTAVAEEIRRKAEDKQRMEREREKEIIEKWEI